MFSTCIVQNFSLSAFIVLFKSSKITFAEIHFLWNLLNKNLFYIKLKNQ